MNRLRAIPFLLAAFFGLYSLPVNAQYNLKSGYNISFLSSPGLDQLISDYNSSQGYSKAFSNLSWIHGFELGVRYKNNAQALELTYQGGYQVLSADGKINSGLEPYTDKMRFSVQSGALGYQVAGERGGIGADLQYQWYSNKVDLAQSTEDFKNTQTMMAMKLYLMLNFPGRSGVDLALQPYIVLPFKTYNLDPLCQYLQQEAIHANDKWVRFGLTLMFYNGRK